MSNGDNQIIDFTVADRTAITAIVTKLDLYHEEVKTMKVSLTWFKRTAVGSLLTALTASIIALVR
jgi:hypothetical protein